MSVICRGFPSRLLRQIAQGAAALLLRMMIILLMRSTQLIPSPDAVILCTSSVPAVLPPLAAMPWGVVLLSGVYVSVRQDRILRSRGDLNGHLAEGIGFQKLTLCCLGRN